MASLYKILQFPVYEESDWKELSKHENCFEKEGNDCLIETFEPDTLDDLLNNDGISDDLKEQIQYGLKKYKSENPDCYLFYYEGEL